MKKIIICFLVSILSGCAISNSTVIPKEENFGRMPIITEKEVHDLYELELIDPLSTIYKLQEPKKGYLTDGFNGSGKIIWQGYYSIILINSKNRFGGYVGWKSRIVFYKNGKWQRIYNGTLNIETENGWKKINY